MTPLSLVVPVKYHHGLSAATFAIFPTPSRFEQRAEPLRSTGCDLVANGKALSFSAGPRLGGVTLLLAAGVPAGMMGSADGIASLISYPVLLAVGIPAKPANLADTVALVASLPGSALGSRPELRGQGLRVARLGNIAALCDAALRFRAGRTDSRNTARTSDGGWLTWVYAV